MTAAAVTAAEPTDVAVGGMVWGPKDAADTPIGYRLAVEMGHPAPPKPIGKAARMEGGDGAAV